MNDLFSTEGLWAGVFALVLGGNAASWYAQRVRLQDWADAEGIKITKKELGWHFDPKNGKSRFVGRGGRWHRIVVMDSSHYAYTAFIRSGGIFAALLDRDPVVIWQGEPPKKAET